MAHAPRQVAGSRLAAVDGLHMVPIATTRSGFEARVLAARLGSEGIVWQLRGGDPDGVYPLGDVEVLVATDDLDRAREMLAADGLDEQLYDGSDTRDHTEWWMAAAVVALLALFIVLRLFSL
jgi:hypothetical protein